MNESDQIAALKEALAQVIDRCANALCLVREEDKGSTFRSAVEALNAGRETLRAVGTDKKS